MFSYIVGGIAFLLFFYNPIVQYLSSAEPARLPRIPRPRINESLLAIDAANETLSSLANCPPDSYAVHILSKAPLVIYIENFISEAERTHLLDISEPLFEPSTITNDGDSTVRDATVRDSEVALVPRTEAVRCVEARARAFQGWRDDLWIERLRTQRYRYRGDQQQQLQHYAHHFDWGSGARGWGRVSSFMVWVLADDVAGGGTEFPMLRRGGPDEPWCRWVECPEPEPGSSLSSESRDAEPLPLSEVGVGVTFKPVAGNSVYWENFRPDGTGRGWEETWHAGLPVRRGTKVGLNIWSWGRLS